MIDRIADALRPVTDELLLVANASDAEDWLPGARVLRDSGEQRGSLVALRTALAGADGRDVLMVAWDMPFVTPDVLRFIASKLIAPIDAAVPELPSGLEPFCAAYSQRCLPIVDRQLEAGNLRMAAFVDELRVVRRLGVSELTAFGDPSRLFLNVNTPADLARADALAS
jgi:molybdopterin-guanine dinucleotide biosynthesis protein A